MEVSQILIQLSHFSFDMETKTWTVLKPMNIARAEAHAVALNGYIYVVGGRVDVPELYDPKNDKWHRLARMKPDACHDYLTSFKSNSCLYVCGFRVPTYRYDASENSCTEVCNLLMTIEEYAITDTIRATYINDRFILSQVESLQGLVSAVNTSNGIFATRDEFFGKIILDTNGKWSFQMLTQPRKPVGYQMRNFLFWN